MVASNQFGLQGENSIWSFTERRTMAALALFPPWRQRHAWHHRSVLIGLGFRLPTMVCGDLGVFVVQQATLL
jgi:hypothetical protein